MRQGLQFKPQRLSNIALALMSKAHRADLGTSEALLKGCTEAITGIGSHRVEAAVAVVAEGEGSHGQTERFSKGCETGERPVDDEGDQIGDKLFKARRQAADQQPGGV